MITGSIKSQVDKVWDAFWSGGISNPLRGDRADHLPPLPAATRRPADPRGEQGDAAREADSSAGSSRRGTIHGAARTRTCAGRGSRTSRLRRCTTSSIEHVFPFLRTLGGDGSTYAHHMKDARFTIPTPALLAKVVDLIAEVPMEDRDTKGDLYEYMLGKIATAGQNGQFRTPRHIIQLMVEMIAPDAGRCHLRPCLRHGGLPDRCGRIPARAQSRDAPATRSRGRTSTTRCSTASTSTTRCSASAA